MRVNKAKEYVRNSDSKLANSESKDCTVWAYASAFDVDYNTAHEELSKRFGRLPKKGIKKSAFVNELTEVMNQGEELHGHKITMAINKPQTETKWKLQGEKRMRRMRIKTFVQQYPSNTYLVIVRNHALVIKMGEVIDVEPSQFPEKRIVDHAFCIEPTVHAGSN